LARADLEDGLAPGLTQKDTLELQDAKKRIRLLEQEAEVMRRVGACGDNAAMESFFALLQKNVLDRKRWESQEELRLEIITWIEGTYHRRRRQLGLGRLTPIEFEILHTALQAA
jgi:hypothetical protein